MTFFLKSGHGEYERSCCSVVTYNCALCACRRLFVLLGFGAWSCCNYLIFCASLRLSSGNIRNTERGTLFSESVFFVRYIVSLFSFPIAPNLLSRRHVCLPNFTRKS